MLLLLWYYLFGSGSVIAISFIYYYYRTYVSPFPRIDGPKYPSILFEFLQDRNIELTVTMSEWCAKYPRMFHLRRHPPSFVVNDLDLVKELLVHNELINHFSQATLFFHSQRIPTIKSLLFLKDEQWKNRRKALGHSFNTSKILGLVEVFQKKAIRLKDSLLEAVDKKKKVDMRQNFAKLTVDILGESVFGVNFDCIGDSSNKLSKAVDSFLNLGPSTAFLLFPFWYTFPIASIRGFLSGVHTLSTLCRRVVDNRQKTGAKNNDLLQTLVDTNLDLNEAIIPETFLFLLAGHETTANLLSWTIYLISQNPSVEQKMVEEIDRVVGVGQEVTSEKVDALEYLECIINESLRLHPPVLLTDRTASVPVTFDGKHFPKGTQFVIPIWAIHHNPLYWPDPYKFDPSRFDADHKQENVPFSFLPFGGGARMCIGWKFALIEAKVALATIYSSFHITLQEPVKAVNSGFLLRPRCVNVTVERRKRE